MNVLDPEFRALKQSQAPAVHQRRHQPHRAAQPRQERPDLVARQHHRKANVPLGARNLAHPRRPAAGHHDVQELNGIERLVLRRTAHASRRKTHQEGDNISRAQFSGMALSVENDQTTNPGNVGLFGPPAVVLETDHLPNAVEELRRRTTWWSEIGRGQVVRYGASRSPCQARMPRGSLTSRDADAASTQSVRPQQPSPRAHTSTSSLAPSRARRHRSLRRDAPAGDLCLELGLVGEVPGPRGETRGKGAGPSDVQAAQAVALSHRRRCSAHLEVRRRTSRAHGSTRRRHVGLLTAVSSRRRPCRACRRSRPAPIPSCRSIC